MDRRSFLAGSTSAALLAGCTVAPRPAVEAGTPRNCPPPLRVDPGHVIREVVGLRPYRRAGFVVRADSLDGKRLVHNYGHGGAGITLSWGSAKLATDLGLPGHTGPVAVIGAGVMGLSVARLVQEAGFPVTIYTKALPPETTSNIAGGQIAPHGHYRGAEVTPAWRAQYEAAMAYSWQRFQIMVGEDYGIRWLPTYEAVRNFDKSAYGIYARDAVLLDPAEHPFPADNIALWHTMYVEVGRYLRATMRDVRLAGGSVAIRDFATLADVAALPETLVFNCTGIGARELVGDEELVPARGQLAVLMPQPEIRYAYHGGGGYMFPRPDGILLGGSFDIGEWDTTPDPALTARIVERHRRLAERWTCPAVR